MKPHFLIVALIALSFDALSQNIDQIIKRSATSYTEIFDTSAIKKNNILIPLKHSSSKIENPELFNTLKGKVIYAITLIYTEPDRRLFDQEKLNRKRLIELNKIAPDIIGNSLISWGFIEQKMTDKYDDKNLFHGYLITLRPQLDGKNGLTEFQVLKKMVTSYQSLCNDTSKKESIALIEDSSEFSSTALAKKIKHATSEKPIFPKGENVFFDYLRTNIIYTKAMQKQAVSGELNATFYINNKGELSKTKINDDLTKEARKAVTDALKKMPNWLPGVKWIPGVNPPKKVIIGGSFRLALFFSLEQQKVYVKYLYHQGPYYEKSISETLGDYDISNDILCDNAVFEALERNKQWKNMNIVADLTGSMFPYTSQLILWFKLKSQDGDEKSFTFFNDGDDTPQNFKKTGEVGGIYQTKTSSYLDIMDLAQQTMRYSGGDAPENNIEATIAALESYPEVDDLIMIADNYATPRDLKLLRKVKQPIHLILCGTKYGINIEYLNLVRKNGGTLHTIENDLTGLTKMNEGEILNFNSRYFKIVNGEFLEVYKL